MVAQYVSRYGAGVFVRGLRGADPVEVFEQLMPHGERLEQQLGARIESRTKGYFLEKSLPVDGFDRANWDRMADWLHEQRRAYEDALAQAMG